ARRRNEFRYGDPRFLGTGNRLLGHFAATDRGAEYGALLNRPFYSYASPFSNLTSWARVQQQETRYSNGDEADSFLDDFRAVRGLAAWRLGSGEDFVHRAGVGWRYEQSRFSSLDTTVPGTLPADRTLSGPQLSYAVVEPRYLKATDIDRVNVIEDFNLGWELGLEGGPLPRALGSDRDRWALRGTLQRGLGVGSGRFGLVQAVADGREAHGHLENGIVTGALNMFWETSLRYRQTLVTHAEYTAVKNLDGERQLNLGGDTGLRGYKNDAFQGGRVALVNLEDRLFFSPDFFHLVYVGAAGFVEAGTAVPEGARFMGAPWKADLGLGLRLSPSRGSSGSVLRIDVAYALSRGPGRS
ncbi:MAG: hypothetical protein KGL53_06625, partial [Elusimicrobia bacterium]|nr:hypothetical protein [Elusimicrobiota bacterium]